MTNCADLDQLTSEEANRSGSTLFAKAVHIHGSAGLGLIVGKLRINPFIPEILKWTLPFLNLDLSTANRTFSQK